MNKLSKFQEPAGELPTNFVSWDPVYRFGTKPNESKTSTIDQFRFNQESPLRQFVQTVSSEEEKQNQQYSGNYYYTSTKDSPRPNWVFIRSEEPLKPMEQEIAEVLPGTGDVAEVTQIGKDLSQGNIGNALLGAGLFLIPGNWNKFVEKLKSLRFNFKLNQLTKTPEFNYRVREHSRNEQLQNLMNYGSNSDILVHGDPAGIGVTKVGTAIGSSDGKLTSFPHFENDMLVPGKGQSLRIKQKENIRQIDNEDRPIFWGDGIPFYETRKGHMSMFDNDQHVRWLATGNSTHRIQNPNDFILDHPYRYIATKRSSTLNPITTRTGISRDMTEIQSKAVPIDKIWGIEWDPLTQTWGKTIYNINGRFYKQGGKIDENN